MKIFVIGSNGQLGSSLIQIIKERGEHSVVSTSRKDLDITNKIACKSLIEKENPDVVINAAAYNNVDMAESEPEKAYAVNRDAPAYLAEVTAHLEIPFVHVSTDYVFDGTSKRAYIESDRPNPLSVYGKSKREGEIEVLKNNPMSFVVRTAWVFSKYGSNFVLRMMELAKKGEIKVSNDQYSSPTYAPHLAEGILSLIGGFSPPGLYHMAGGGEATRYALMTEVFQMMGYHGKITGVPSDSFSTVAKRPRYTPLATEKVHFYSMSPWERGVAEFVQEIGHGMRVS